VSPRPGHGIARTGERSLAARFAREALLAIRSGAEALELGRTAEARALLHSASTLLIRLHVTLHESSGGVPDVAGRLCRTACYRLNDAALLRDPAAARAAEEACAPLAAALDAVWVEGRGGREDGDP